MSSTRSSESTHDTRQWFHIILTTYGAWLPGDLRGFRTRHHREHVEGDYHDPPPRELYAARRQRSETLLKQPPVTLPTRLRPVVGRAIRNKLRSLGADVLCLAVAGRHVHIQTKMPPTETRQWAGRAKKRATLELREHGWQGKVWAARGKFVSILSSEHQERVYQYILQHRAEGAWVWSALD